MIISNATEDGNADELDSPVCERNTWSINNYFNYFKFLIIKDYALFEDFITFLPNNHISAYLLTTYLIY